MLNTVLEILYPSLCLLCGGPLLFASRGNEPVCLDCLDRLQPIGGRRCRICSAALIAERDTCTGCRERSPVFESHFSLFEFRGPIRELLYQYKFRDRRRLACLFARLLAEPCRNRFAGLPVVPVPARPGRAHVEWIARRLERDHGIRVERVLARRGRTAQKTLGYEERLRNIRGAFTIADDAAGRTAREALAGGVVLLDDIFTTGATADECARVLLKAGSGPVRALTLAMD